MSKLIITIYVLATSFALIALKLGSKNGAPVHILDNKLQFNINFYTIAGTFLYALSFMLYMYLISKFDLGYIIPLVTALVYVIIFLASYFIFKEAFTLIKIIGIILIIAGMIMLNLKK